MNIKLLGGLLLAVLIIGGAYWYLTQDVAVPTSEMNDSITDDSSSVVSTVSPTPKQTTTASQGSSLEFVQTTVKPGDRFGASTVLEVRGAQGGIPGPENIFIRFGGPIVWRGTFEDITLKDGEPFAEMINGPYIKLSAESEKTVPHPPLFDFDRTVLEYRISNPAVIGSDIKDGDLVEVVVDEYTYIEYPSEGSNSLTLKSIKKI